MNIGNGKIKELLLSFKRDSRKIFNLNKEWVRVPFQRVIESINESKKKKNKKFIDIPRYTIHEIRKTFGTKYAKQLMPIELMNLIRHKDISTTLRYYVGMQITDIAEKLNGK